MAYEKFATHAFNEAMYPTDNPVSKITPRKLRARGVSEVTEVAWWSKFDNLYTQWLHATPLIKFQANEACCVRARRYFCVCRLATVCPIHGIIHKGTHD